MRPLSDLTPEAEDRRAQGVPGTALTPDKVAELDRLIAEAKARFEALTPAQQQRHREEQAMSFAYGNLAMSSRHKPQREAFRKLATERYGWDDATFAQWAEGRQW